MSPSHFATCPASEPLEHYLAAIVTSSDDAMFSQDAAGHVTSWNPAAERLLGYPELEMVGRPAKVLFEASGGLDAVLGQVLEGQTMEAGTAVMVHQDGETLEVSLRTSPVIDPSGEVVGAATIARDNTEQERVRNERDRVTEELRRSNAELEQFAYVASHDLSEPLRMIGGFVQLLSKRYEGQLGGEADEFIGYVVDGVERMRALIDDLLQFSRVGRATLERETVDVTALVDQVLGSLRLEISEAEAVVVVGELPTLEADPTQLRRVFQNLVSNALKFRGTDPPRIEISAAREHGAWRFTVADNGIGIESRHATRIFDLFERLHDQQTYAGTGLGLAICRTVVERHGGQIWAGLGESGGTTFFFTLRNDRA